MPDEEIGFAFLIAAAARLQAGFAQREKTAHAAGQFRIRGM